MEGRVVNGSIKNWLVVTLFLVALALSTGCAHTSSWSYETNEFVPRPRKIGETAVVLPFTDARASRNADRFLLFMLPLSPYGFVNYDRPEDAEQHTNSAAWLHFEPKDDFAKALAEDLTAAGIFSEARFDHQEGESRYVIKGRILKTHYNGKVLSYGLGFYGWFLWFVGAPASITKNTLVMELECYDTVRGETVYKKEYSPETVRTISWFYYQQDDFNYPDLVRTVYKQFIQELAGALTLIE